VNFNLLDHTILLTKAGSRSYGTFTPTSDVDVKGICIAPINYYLGLERFEQADSPVHFQDPSIIGLLSEDEQRIVKETKIEGTVYNITKMAELMLNNNPNCLEVLFVNESHLLKATKAAQTLRDNRDLFLSAKCVFTYSGYAHSQLKRMKTHRRYLLEGEPPLPTRSEFGLPENLSNNPLFPKGQLDAAKSMVKKRLDEWETDLSSVEDDAIRMHLVRQFQGKLEEIAIGFQLLTEGRKLRDVLYPAAAMSLGFDTNFLEYLDRERRYDSKLSEYKQYQEWKRSRNPSRAAMEAKYGMDCYSYDTEFLTDSGWKLSDSISTEDKLATIFVKDWHEGTFDHKTDLGIEYQNYLEKFDAKYTGNMYQFEGIHTDTLVTADHRMLYQHVRRRSGEVLPEWRLEEAALIPETFDVLVAPKPALRMFKNPQLDLPIRIEDYLALVGWYVSDGSSAFLGEDVKAITISQRPDGKLAQAMKRWHKRNKDIAQCSIYTYNREPTSYCPYPSKEMVLSVREDRLKSQIVADCSRTTAKRLPRWLFTTSKYLMEIVLYSALGGDGTLRKHKTVTDSYIYYSSLSNLADDIQELGVCAGWETAKWGPFDHKDNVGNEGKMYQVHLRPPPSKDEPFTRRLLSGSNKTRNVKVVPVTDHRVVCFSVPNKTLITRRNGKVSIHGNCKHASHCLRLLNTAEEILTKGTLTVDRTGIDADLINAVRNGAWKFEQLEQYVQDMDEKLMAIYKAKTYKVPHSPDRNKVSALVTEILQEHFDPYADRSYSLRA
jgi:predicted nucleotidyltransferase